MKVNKKTKEISQEKFIPEAKYLLRAFTLIEILIGLIIFSIIAISLYSTFFSGTSIWRRSEDKNRLYQEARWSLDTMAKELRNAIIFHYGENYPNFLAFRGTSADISFLIATDSGIKRIRYFIQREEQNQDITVFSLKREELSLIDSLQATGTDKASIERFSDLVAENGLKFSYAYGSPDDIEWQDTWKEKEYLPALIQIKLLLRNPRNPNLETEFNKRIFIPTGIIGMTKGK
jgi:prepilin-type N-terminal cleavage/methylation domain-containing protein